MNPVHDIPPEKLQLLDKARGRMNGLERNAHYKTERAIRSAHEALRLLLYLWLWHHCEAAQPDQTLDCLLDLCRQSQRDAQVATLADEVLAGCANLHKTPPRSLGDYTPDELHAELAREAAPGFALQELDELVQKALGERLRVKKGDWIRQFHYGVGRIKAIDGCGAEVDLASPRPLHNRDEPLWISLIHGEVEKIDFDAEVGKQKEREAETFVFEAEPERIVSMQRQMVWWSQFMEPDDIGERLGNLLSDTRGTFGYGHFRNAKEPSSIEWPSARIIQYPASGIPQAAFVWTVGTQPDKPELVAGYPYYYLGMQVALKLDRVHVWPDRALAQLDCTWGEAIISFFEVEFAANRVHYCAGETYEFILAGIAYAARTSTLDEMEVPEGTLRESLRKGRQLAGLSSADEDVDRLSFRGMAALLPRAGTSRDVCGFRGPIKSVKPIDLLGASGWCVEAAVLRDASDDSEFDLRIVVTARAWEGDTPPREGDDIEGILWLQGRLWSIPRNTKRPE